MGEADGADVRDESCGDAPQDEDDRVDQVETASESRADDDRNAQTMTTSRETEGAFTSGEDGVKIVYLCYL